MTKGGTEVHFTSFAELEPRVKEVENRSQLFDGKPVQVSFHEIGGSSMLKMFNKINGRSFEKRKPGMKPARDMTNVPRSQADSPFER